MRFSVISWATTEEYIDRSADAILAAWRQVRAGLRDDQAAH
jgi:hypothetical protein